ncbi:thioredoxin family protein [Akkermansia muciniphila]|uniref:thioredoxin family protein n=2 Tax=Akkermansiaceae TaxID=1647988 RepID=UPI001C023393|nr:thioredoxin family protein [Akkermansia muciniphila]MBT9593557.1 thioredoxin family protein [Akkermansia muciniphila]
MTDAPAPRQPSGETLPPAEDETRFAPKENGGEHKDENSAPAAKKRLKTSLDVVSEHAAEEESARQEDSERKARGDALFWNLCLGLFALIVISAGYIVYEKFSQLPDPVKDAREALEDNHAQLLKKQEQLREIRNRTAPKEQLLSLLDIFEHTASDLEETQKSIEKEKMRVAGIRGEIRSYFERYRQHARAKARGRKFDILKTSHSGKTYLNVEITRVENEFVRIMHEQGSTSIPAGDLPDDIREMLAYGDPLNITAMNQTDASLKSPVIRRAPSPAPAAAPVPQPAKKKVVVEDLDPPAGKPKIETPTHTGDSGSSSSGNMWVPPRPFSASPPCNNDIPAMKTIIHPLAAILLAWSAGASETWSTSPAEAMQQAAAQNKGVMLEFTGSDWCGACIMQKKQALSLPEIQTAISRSFIPVELDYPRKKQQDAQTKTSLETYKKSYGITGFPTLVFADAQGRPVHTVVGYANPAQVMQDTKKAAEALNTQQSLTNNLAEKLTDQQRRDTLVQLLKTVPQSSIRTFYKPALAELEKLDPQDASGILAKLHRDDLLHAQKLEWADTFRKKNIHILADQNPDEALSIMDSYLKKNGLLPEVKQAVLMQKVYLLMQQNRVNELEQPLKEGVALLPKSFEGKAFSKLLDKLPEIKKERGLLKPGEEPPLPPGAIRATKMIVPTAPAK